MATSCAEIKIKIEPTVGYIPLANGIAERINKTRMEIAIPVRMEGELIVGYSQFSARAATCLHDKGSVTAIRHSMASVVWTEADFKHYIVFCCLSYVLIPPLKT
jgi:hypothetical protein